MFKKIIAVFLLLATTTLFGMSLSSLNSASKAELMEINGIGEKKANAILKERRKGKFKSFEDFQRVEGIGTQTAANVKAGVKSGDKVKKSTKKTTKKTSKKTKPSTKSKKEKTKKKSTTKTSKSTKDKKTTSKKKK